MPGLSYGERVGSRARRACLPLGSFRWGLSRQESARSGWLQRDLTGSESCGAIFLSPPTPRQLKKSQVKVGERVPETVPGGHLVSQTAVSAKRWDGVEGSHKGGGPRLPHPGCSGLLSVARSGTSEGPGAQSCCAPEELCNRKRVKLSFPICKMCTVTSILQKCHEDYMRWLCQHDATAVG